MTEQEKERFSMMRLRICQYRFKEFFEQIMLEIEDPDLKLSFLAFCKNLTKKAWKKEQAKQREGNNNE